MDLRFAASLGSLQEKRIRDVWPSREIVWVFSSCPLDVALKTMKERRILSVPVVEPNSNVCIGVIDVQEIAFFIVSSFPSLDLITPENLRLLQFEEKRLATDTTVAQVMAYSRQFNYKSLPLFPFKSDSLIIDLMKTFSAGVHRVPVVDDDNKILNFISQSDLNRYLCEEIYLLGDRGNRTVSELGLSTKPVVYARGDAMAIQALDIMAKQRISALPIVDLDGRLIGNFSCSDLRGMGPDDFIHLLRPIGQVLALFNPKSLFPLTCNPTNTLEYVMLKLAASKVHRLWVVGNNLNIVGVATLSDVMRPFLDIALPMEAIPTTITTTTPVIITPSPSLSVLSASTFKLPSASAPERTRIPIS